MSQEIGTRADELRGIADQLGISISELGRRIGANDTNFRRFARLGPSGRPAPDEVMLKVRALVKSDTLDPFIVGTGDDSGWRYVIHTGRPAFTAIMETRERIGRVVWHDKPKSAAETARLEQLAIAASLRNYHREYKKSS